MKSKLPILVSLFFLVMVVGVSLVSGATCNGTGNVINSTTISDGCTLSSVGTYVMSGETFNLNGITDGSIRITSNITLEGNGSSILGNFSGTSVGIKSLGNSNVIIRNLSLNNYNIGIRIDSASNLNVTNWTFDNIKFGYNFTFGNFYIATGTGSYINGVIIKNSIINVSLPGTNAGLRFFDNGFGISNVIIQNNKFYQYGSDSNNKRLISFGDGGLMNNFSINSNNFIGSGIKFNEGIYLKAKVNNSIISNNNFSYFQYPISVTNQNFYITALNISSNLIFNSDEGTIISNSLGNVYIENNKYQNITFDYDDYDNGIKLSNSSNNYILNNNFSEIGTTAIQLSGSYNTTINGNYFYTIPMNLRDNYLADDTGDSQCSIKSIQLYKSFFLYFGNDNLSISNNTFDSNTQCFLQLENTTNVNHDFVNYWGYSFSTPTNLKGRIDYYMSNNYNNLSRYSSGIYYDIYSNFNGYFANYTKYILSKDYLYILNVNNSIQNSSIYNLTNALIYNTNGSIYGNSDISLNDGNINITLPPNNASCVFDNANLTEGVSIGGGNCAFPLWFAQVSLNEIHIASNISAINTTVKINNPGWGENCRFVTELSYTPNGSATLLWQDDIQAQSICTQLTTTGYVLQVNPSTDSNVIRVTYSEQPQGGGGGGSTGGDPLGNTDLILCNLTYNYIKNHSQTDYSYIDSVRGNYSWTETRRYLDNWQPFCSDAIKKTLKEEFVCDKLFYMIVAKPDYSLIEINTLRNQIVNDIQISNNLLLNYADNYETMCKYNKNLPFKREKVGNLTIIKNLTDCSLNTSLSLLGLDYDQISVPLGKIYINEKSCSAIANYRWFVKFERDSEGLFINGIKLGWLISVFIFLAIFLIIKTQFKTKAIEKGLFKK